MNREEELVRKRLLDLANRAYEHNTYIYTPFLSMADQSVLLDMQKELSFVSFQLWGGIEGCERQMAAFGSQELFGYEPDFPIQCIRISPLAKKFAENMSHRDFLGALMNLGLERDVLGDIMVREKEAYVFCQDAMVSYVIDKISRIRHTSVKAELVTELPESMLPRYVERQDTVASLRLDVIVAAAYHLSRNQSHILLTEQKVFVNGRLNGNPSHMLQEADVISVRGYGRFILTKVLGITKKGKLLITISKPEA